MNLKKINRDFFQMSGNARKNKKNYIISNILQHTSRFWFSEKSLLSITFSSTFLNKVEMVAWIREPRLLLKSSLDLFILMDVEDCFLEWVPDGADPWFGFGDWVPSSASSLSMSKTTDETSSFCIKQLRELIKVHLDKKSG